MGYHVQVSAGAERVSKRPAANEPEQATLAEHAVWMQSQQFLAQLAFERLRPVAEQVPSREG